MQQKHNDESAVLRAEIERIKTTIQSQGRSFGRISNSKRNYYQNSKTFEITINWEIQIRVKLFKIGT